MESLLGVFPVRTKRMDMLFAVFRWFALVLFCRLGVFNHLKWEQRTFWMAIVTRRWLIGYCQLGLLQGGAPFILFASKCDASHILMRSCRTKRLKQVLGLQGVRTFLLNHLQSLTNSAIIFNKIRAQRGACFRKLQS